MIYLLEIMCMCVSVSYTVMAHNWHLFHILEAFIYVFIVWINIYDALYVAFPLLAEHLWFYWHSLYPLKMLSSL